MKGIEVKGSKIGMEEIQGFIKQIDNIENISLIQCRFTKNSFAQLCEAIRHRNGKVCKLCVLRNSI